jgi:hypothetical protein
VIFSLFSASLLRHFVETMKPRSHTSILISSIASIFLAHQPVAAQNAMDEIWYQVEMTIFTYENANLDVEVWSPDRLNLAFPERLRVLSTVADILQLEDWSLLTGTPPASTDQSSNISEVTPSLPTGPQPFNPGDSFTLPDFARSGFLALPPSEHDFTGPNRTLTQSSAHRIVLHKAWRQPISRRNTATAIGLKGGREFGSRNELEGSVTFYLNNAEDRVSMISNLWLTSFGVNAPATQTWNLPLLPAVLLANQAEDMSADAFHINRIIPFNQTREIRDGEFHYLDHPAMGILVQLTSYTVPDLPLPALEDTELEDATAVNAAQDADASTAGASGTL